MKYNGEPQKYEKNSKEDEKSLELLSIYVGKK